MLKRGVSKSMAMFIVFIFSSCVNPFKTVLWIQLYWIWIWILNFGPILIQIQGYVINWETKFYKIILRKNYRYFQIFLNNKKKWQWTRFLVLCVSEWCISVFNLAPFTSNLSNIYLRGSDLDPDPQHSSPCTMYLPCTSQNLKLICVLVR